jgi:hypothetical protein
MIKLTGWRIISLVVAQTIFLAFAVACYAGNPTYITVLLLLTSMGPWIGAMIMAMFQPDAPRGS